MCNKGNRVSRGELKEEERESARVAKNDEKVKSRPGDLSRGA